MQVSRLEIGEAREPVLVFDGLHGDIARVVEIAARLEPFPPATNFYPGLRRLIGPADAEAWAYATSALRAAGPAIVQAFGIAGFDLLEASFSLVTAPPETLRPPQRHPHFDSTDPDYLAALHYVSTPMETGTAFFRQRSTGLERIGPQTLGRFVAAAQREGVGARGYICGSDPWYEETGRIEARADRLIVYRGSLLHSGIIPPGASLPGRARDGRLTANFFLQARRDGVGAPRR